MPIDSDLDLHFSLSRNLEGPATAAKLMAIAVHFFGTSPTHPANLSNLYAAVDEGSDALRSGQSATVPSGATVLSYSIFP